MVCALENIEDVRDGNLFVTFSLGIVLKSTSLKSLFVTCHSCKTPSNSAQF